jgi:hypothetical protein
LQRNTGRRMLNLVNRKTESPRSSGDALRANNRSANWKFRDTDTPKKS